ncbi:MAG: ABC transporter ATP-binding protein [Planctomycetota bacterium]|jgi:ABC-type sugar transport system ATPase subunit|nr:ABC transporter ATP-binding protein [Planctomycetota bacterium]
MAQITLEKISKSFGSVKALDAVDLEVKDKEFFVLFGPAGAGKTTILKTIAGVEFPDSGLVRIGDRIVNLIDPALRNVSMVFENYALYPHMKVYDNIASPMRSPLHRKSEAEIAREVARVSDLMGISQLMERLPSQLSNGQRQRTALGRCLVRRPNVFLMDEPLAHLDAKLRHLMRTELKAMQTAFDTTTIYVTHDYSEALSLGDRIAILNRGKFEQIGTGDEVYYAPVNEFVARLVGEPEINIVDAELQDVAGECRVGIRAGASIVHYPLPDDIGGKLHASGVGRRIRMGIRGVNIAYKFEKAEGYLPGSVYNLEPIGNKSILTIKTDENLFQTIASNDLSVELDTPVWMYPDPKNMLLFDAADGRFLGRHHQAQLTGRA